MILKSLWSQRPVTKRHWERRLIATPIGHLFGIIQDVDRYSEFLPLCSSSKILNRSKRVFSPLPHHHHHSSTSSASLTRVPHRGTPGEEDYYFEAELTVGLPPFFRETYVSAVTVRPSAWSVETRSIQSQVLDSVRSQWRLEPVGDDDHDEKNRIHQAPRCLVNFEVEITVSDPVLVTVLDQVLQKVAGQQVAAFERRCQQIPWTKSNVHQ